MNDSTNERLHELLIDRATDSLTDAQRDELASLLQENDLPEDFSYDNLVATMQESFSKKADNRLPAHVRSQVIDHAETILQPRDQVQAARHDTSPVATSVSRGLYRREALAWMATAAALALAAFLWMQSNRSDSSDWVSNTSLISLSDESSLDNFSKGQNTSDTFQVNLPAGNHASGKGCVATVYWNRKSKRGFLKVNNLATNEPTAEQYQLWIIDRVRGIDDRPNAGVFNVAKKGVNIFEFHSDLVVSDAQGFAVTVEKPGGVAKSDLSKIALANLGT